MKKKLKNRKNWHLTVRMIPDGVNPEGLLRTQGIKETMQYAGIRKHEEFIEKFLNGYIRDGYAKVISADVETMKLIYPNNV